MKINFQVNDLGGLGNLPLVAVIGNDAKCIDEAMCQDGEDRIVVEINEIIDLAYESKELDSSKVDSFTFNNVQSVYGIPSKLVVVNVPDDAPTDAKQRALANDMAKTTASHVMALLKQHDHIILVIGAFLHQNGTNAPSIIRAISDAAYDYKDSVGDAKEKTITISSSAIFPITAGEQRDVWLHDVMKYTRDLITAPPNVVVPNTFVQEAKNLAKANKAIKTTAHDPYGECMNGLAAVARGSSLAPEFVELQYTGNRNKAIDFVFIGKGITYDSGGYSLKPAKSMETMKGDMGGAAAVLGLFKWLSEHGSKLNIVGLIPTCENMIGKDAIVPGEVIHYSNGKTVEVLNTDAEGRLILADALIYSQKFKGARVIDIATLTGGIVVGLGKYRTGLFSDDAELVSQITTAGDASADPVWHMPMDSESYSPKSEVADMPNITSGPSSITAAMFLREFAPEKWAHLDIAGTSGDAVGTARPLPLLVDLINR